MSFQAVQDYSYLNAKIHGKKSKFLSAKDYENLYNSTSNEELFRLISKTNFASDELNQLLLSSGKISPTEIDRILIKEFQIGFAILGHQLPIHAQKFLKAYEKKFFLDALKLILKAKHFGMSNDEIKNLIVIPSAKYQEIIDQLIKFPKVSNIIEQIPFPDYKKALQDALSDYEQFNSPLILELAIFQTYYRKLWIARNSINLTDRNSVFGLVGTEVDLINILAIIRAKKAGMDSETIKKWLIHKNFRLSQQNIDNMINIGNISQIEPIIGSVNSYRELAQQIRIIFEAGDSLSIDRIERKFKEYLVHKAISTLSGAPFQLGIFFSYIHLAEVEFSNVRAIIIGKLAGLNSEDIKNSIIYF